MSKATTEPMTPCLACEKPQPGDTATLCEHCLSKAIVLLNQGSTPEKIAGGRDDIQAILEGWLESKAKTTENTKSVSRETVVAVLIPIDAIEVNPYQPRKEFSEAELQELADSIREHGVLQPILVRPKPLEGYQLIAGERRWRASQLVGLSSIEAVVRKVDDQTMAEMALVENAQRLDISVIEQAVAIKRLKDEFNLSMDYIAQRAGISRPVVANRLRLLDLPQSVQARIAKGELTESHGRALVKYKQFPDFVSFYAGHIVENQLTSKLVENGLHFRPEWSEVNTMPRGLQQLGLLAVLEDCDFSFVKEDDLLFEHSDTIFKGSFCEDEECLICLDVTLANTLHEQWAMRAEDERKAAQKSAKNPSDSTQSTSNAEPTPVKKTALERYQAGEIKTRQDLNYDEYDSIHSDCPKACSSCVCKVTLPSSPGSKFEQTVCLDPKRHRALKAQESRIKNKARRESIANLSEKIFPAIDERYDALLEGDILPVLALAAFEGMNAKSVTAAAERLNIDFDYSKFSYDSNRANKLTMLSKVQGLARFTIEALLRDELRKAAENDYDKPTRTTWLLEVLDENSAD